MDKKLLLPESHTPEKFEQLCLEYAKKYKKFYEEFHLVKWPEYKNKYADFYYSLRRIYEHMESDLNEIIEIQKYFDEFDEFKEALCEKEHNDFTLDEKTNE
jgi:hypothetical protein